jgi:hypothetical protein
VLHPSQRLLAQLHAAGQTPEAFPVYNLHALLLARSPTLFACLSRFGNHPPPYTLHLEFDDVHLTVGGLDVVLGTLYSGGTGLPSALNELDRPAATDDAESGTVSSAPTSGPSASHGQTPAGLHVGVLAAAQLLGLHDIAQQAWQTCTRRWRTEEGVAEGLRYALSMGYLESRSSSEDGRAASTTPGDAESADRQQAQQQQPSAGRLLLDDLIDRLVRGLPNPQLEAVLLTLPFSLVKQSLEHPHLALSSMERHHFARRIVAARKQAGVTGPGVEESVVVAFGRDSRSGGIEVLRRERGAKKKQLWRAPQQ